MGFDDYPLPAFYFSVAFSDTLGVIDSSFQEVSGIGPEMKTESLIEGGENRFVHQLPTSVENPKLVLKRGIAGADSILMNWCATVLESDFSSAIETKSLHVYLLDEDSFPVRCWFFNNAFPVHWEIEAFNSTKNEVAVEKIELNYTYSNRIL